jgi:hypothetical protein
MEGKCDEVLACKHTNCEAKTPSAGNKIVTSTPKSAVATGKPGRLHYDTSGQAYLLNSETH